MNPALQRAIDVLRSGGATVVESPVGVVVVLPRGETHDGNEYLSLAEAARIAKLRSPRALKDAARAGEIKLFGKPQSRVVKRGDLQKWIESRGSKPIAGPDDADLDRRIARLARLRNVSG